MVTVTVTVTVTDMVMKMTNNMPKKKFLIKHIFWLLILFIDNISYGQNTGPAGISNSSNLSVWLDATKITLNDGDPISQWDDISGNSNHFFQSNSSFRPTFSETSILNSKPSVRFASQFFQSLAIPSLESSNISWVIVFKTYNTAIQVLLRSSYQSGAGNMAGNNSYWGTYSQGTGIPTISHVRNQDNQFQSSTYSAGNNSVILTNIWNSTSTFETIVDGSSISNVAGANSTPLSHNHLSLGTNSISPNSNQMPYTGYISEVHVYNKSLNNAEYIILNNYLSSKYGITLSSNSKYNYGTNYGFEVAGIGRVDASNKHLDAQGESIFRVVASSLDDGDFLLWGNDGSNLTSTSTGVPSSFPASAKILERKWRFSETGETGDVVISCDVSNFGFGDLTSYELVIDSDGDFTSGSTLISGSNVGNIISFNVPSASLNDGDYMTLGNTSTNISSVSSGDWNIASTWDCTCTPSSSNPVSILSSHDVTINAPATAKSINIENGASLEISSLLDLEGDILNNGSISSSGSGSRITLTGNWTNSGTYTYQIGDSVTFDGTNNSSIDGNTDWSILTINNIGGVNVNSGNQNIFNKLNIINGVFDANNLTTIKSNINGTAFIDNVENGSVINNITVERYLDLSSTGSQGWREITSPVQGSQILDWQNNGIIFSGFPNSSYPSFSFVNAFTYNESTLGSSSLGWTSPTDIIDPTGPNNGYRVYMDSTNQLLSVSGEPYIGIQTINVTQTGGAGNDNGWNLIGNPYPCAVNWNSLNRTNVDNNYWIWNQDKNNYGSWNGSVGTNDVSGIIASSQAFWVKANASNGSLEFLETSKSNQDAFFIRSNINPKMRITVSNTINNYSDEVVFILDSSSTNSFDLNKDVLKKYSEDTLNSPSLSIITNDNFPLSISYESINNYQNLILDFKPGFNQSGLYSLNFDLPTDFFRNGCLFLKDLYNDSIIDLRIQSTYNFNTNDTMLTKRFLINLSKNFESQTNPTSCYGSNDGQIEIYGDSLIGNLFTINNVNGVNLFSAIADSNQIILNNLNSGIYYITSNINNSCYYNYDSVLIESSHIVLADFAPTLDTTYLSNDSVVLGFNNSSIGGNEFSWDFGDGNSSSSIHPINFYKAPGNYLVELNVTDSNFNNCTYQKIKNVVVIDSLFYNYIPTFLNDITLVFEGNNIILNDIENINEKLYFDIYNILGQNLYHNEIKVSDNFIKLNVENVNFLNQIYFLKISNNLNDFKTLKFTYLH